MRQLMGRALLAALVAAFIGFTPGTASASETTCTDNYSTCLNDASAYSGFLQTMAEIECFAAYTGCVTKKVLKGE
jgi:hypothetical protein